MTQPDPNPPLNEVQVPVVGLSWLLSTHVPTAAKVLAKMDIEGSEYDVRGPKKKRGPKQRRPK